MSSNSPLPPEAFSAERLIERTWVEFGRKTLSQGALYVLWGSFESAEELSDRYFGAKGEKHLLDKRRRLTEDEVERVEGVRDLARQALEYRNWARTEAGNPILGDVLVAYCAAFENALKSVALAFRVASEYGGCVGPVLLKNNRLRDLRRDVQRAWDQAIKSPKSTDVCTAQCFYVEQVLRLNPAPERWPFKDPDDMDGAKYNIAPSNHWPIVNEAFRLRNKILHQNGYLDVQIEIADQVVHAGDDVQLDARVVKRVHGALSGLLSPLDPLPF